MSDNHKDQTSVNSEAYNDALDTTSTIPKTETENWAYPTVGQFHNAIKSKHKNNIKPPKYNEHDLKNIVRIHNIVNEKAWENVMQYESIVSNCKLVKLKSFVGKPKNYSIKARINHYLLGYKMPFDRHDWTVDRCGKQIKYILDFYKGNVKQSSKNETPNINDANRKHLPPAFYLDVRPSVFTLNGLKTYIIHKYRLYINKSN